MVFVSIQFYNCIFVFCVSFFSFRLFCCKYHLGSSSVNGCHLASVAQQSGCSTCQRGKHTQYSSHLKLESWILLLDHINPGRPSNYLYFLFFIAFGSMLSYCIVVTRLFHLFKERLVRTQTQEVKIVFSRENWQKNYSCLFFKAPYPSASAQITVRFLVSTIILVSK